MRGEAIRRVSNYLNLSPTEPGVQNRVFLIKGMIKDYIVSQISQNFQTINIDNC